MGIFKIFTNSEAPDYQDYPKMNRFCFGDKVIIKNNFYNNTRGEVIGVKNQEGTVMSSSICSPRTQYHVEIKNGVSVWVDKMDLSKAEE